MKYVCLAVSLFCVVSVAYVVLAGPAQAQVSFFQSPTYAGSGNVLVADFNGDGKPDILTSDGTMTLGNGDGTFKLGTSVSGASYSTPVLAVADFNGDGKPDVLEQGLGTLLVLLGKGDGTFQAPISTASGASLVAVAATDLNGDGKADVVGVFGSSLVVYISKGDGTFAAGVSYNLGTTGGALLSLGDFNGDGKTDVVVSTSSGTNVVAGQEIVLLGNGDGTFQTTPKTSVGTYYPGFVAVGDFNGDGKLDLAVGSGAVCEGTCTAPAVTYLLLGNGDGTFQAPVSSIPYEAPIAAADVNGDGKLDLIMETGPSIAQVYLGNGDGTFSNVSNYVLNMPGLRANLSVTGIAVADFNLDGKSDIALGNLVQLGNGNGTFQGVPLGVLPTATPIDAFAIGDFDKNGISDVAVTSSQTFTPEAYYVYILRNDGTGKLSWINTYTLQGKAFSIVTADFNGDGNLDLVVTGQGAVSSDLGYSVLLGNGDGSFQPPVFYPQDTNFGGSTVVADFNRDGKLDLAVEDGQSVAILLGNGDGTFATPVLYFDGGGGILVTADFNNDGKLDLAVGAALLFGNGDGTFQPAVFPTNLSAFGPMLTADFNNDGKPDLLSLTQVALGNGDGTFTLLPALSNPWAAVGDFNRDGRLDLVVDVYNGSGVQLGNGDGTFGSVIPILAPGNIVLGYPDGTTYVADMNGDGWPDLVVTPSTNTGGVFGVAVVLNTTTSGFSLSATALSPGTIIAGSSATSTVSLTSTFGFAGTVNLSCAVTPVVTPAPTCSLSSKSVQMSGIGTQTVTVTVGTTAPASVVPVAHVNFPSGPAMFIWMLMLLGSTGLWVRNRKRVLAPAAPIVVLAFAFAVGCGGNGSSSSTAGTPAGTYTATVTATSGSVSNKMALTMVVQ